MSTVPIKKADRVAFFRAHIEPFTDNAAAIGVAPADVTALAALVATAETDLAAQTAAQQVARAAVGTCDLSVRAMTVKGMELIKQVRAKATTAGDAVFPLAQLPVPSVPAPVPPPGQPYGYKVSLDGDGSLTITWKADNPSGAGGTTYRIYRTIAGGEQVYVGGSGQRKFIDTTIPAGATHVTYDIQGIRSTSAGMWGTFVVKFGTNAGGEATASIANAVGPKLAA